MAQLPLSATYVKLLGGVPFTNSYNNTRWFGSRSSQQNYFDSRNVIYSQSNVRFRDGVSFTELKVEKPIEELYGVNYLTFQNAKYGERIFYCFVTELKRNNADVTTIIFEMDVIQTWMFDFEFKPSFVAREHQKLWNSDGTPVINTLDEGLAYGTDYDVVNTRQYRPLGAYKWLVIVSKTSLIDGENSIQGSVIGTPQPLHYYIVPYKDDNSTPNVYVESQEMGGILTKPSELLEVLYTNESAVNDIVSIYVTDWTGIECSYDSDDNLITFPDNGNDIRFLQAGEGTLLQVKHVEQFKPIYDVIYEDKYQHFSSVEESKLLMYPYTVMVATDFKGNQSEYKLEYFDGKDVFINYKGSLGTSNKTSVNFPSYNRFVEDGQSGRTSIENALINNNPSDVPILTDMLSAYLQGNRNSINNQKSSAIWSGVFSTAGSWLGGTVSGAMGNGAGVAQGYLGMGQSVSDTIHSIKGIEAKQQDISNIPPQLANMGNNTAYDYGNGYNGVFFMLKQIKPEYRRKLTDFFKMYGYKQNEVKIPNLHTRKHFNYVETKGCNIVGEINTSDLVKLRSIFDDGITLWHTNDIGNYSLGNEVI